MTDPGYMPEAACSLCAIASINKRHLNFSG